MFESFSRCQARHPSEILPNTQNTVDRKEDKEDERQASLEFAHASH